MADAGALVAQPMTWASGGPPTPAQFDAQRRALQARSRETLATVDGLSRQHAEVGAELSGDLAELSRRGRGVGALQRLPDPGLLAGLLRRLTARRDTLARRSATAALVAQYEDVQVALRRATALADDLAVCAADLQGQVDALHVARADALADAKTVAGRVVAMEAALDDLVPADPETPRQRDRLSFALTQGSGHLDLLNAVAALCGEQLGGARRLRDTVQTLHADTARFVVRAAGTVNEAGRTIQAVGVAADAPMVVGELQAALDRLDEALADSGAVLDQSRHLLTEVLPELTARLETRQEVRRDALTADLDAASRERAHTLAERTLREAAAAEVDALTRRTL